MASAGAYIAVRACGREASRARKIRSLTLLVLREGKRGRRRFVLLFGFPVCRGVGLVLAGLVLWRRRSLVRQQLMSAWVVRCSAVSVLAGAVGGMHGFESIKSQFESLILAQDERWRQA